MAVQGGVVLAVAPGVAPGTGAFVNAGLRVVAHATILQQRATLSLIDTAMHRKKEQSA